ncbi:MAG TPA: hypothetical protein VM537_03370 [Anaerolineae bacterium]|nr:hypothetical protein [Anaerolineae bacterium]
MKIKFLTHCRDLVTSEHYLEGAIVDLPEDRALATIAKGHAVRVNELKRKPGRPPKDKAIEPSEDK